MVLKLPQKDFAKTGKQVSILGLGTVKFGRNQAVKYPEGEGFQLPSDAQVEEILDICLEYGLNLIDTAPAYGIAEERLGHLIGNRRDDLFIVSKTGEFFQNGVSTYDFSREMTEKSVINSLKTLKTDYLDCVLLHSDRDDLKNIMETPVLEVLEEFKQKGDILSYGVSTYTLEGSRKAIDLCDAVMVTYEPDVINDAAEKGKAVLIKKGLASGHESNPTEAIQKIIGNPGVTSLIFGSITKENILNNIKAAIGD